MADVTYDNKTDDGSLDGDPTAISAADMNEIKTAVNSKLEASDLVAPSEKAIPVVGDKVVQFDSEDSDATVWSAWTTILANWFGWLTEKTTTVAADGIALFDSAASNGFKYASFTNLLLSLRGMLSPKTTPVAADEIAMFDSAASNATKYVTLANIKAATAMTASESAQGFVELATTAEINTGTDATRPMCPDQFMASNFGAVVIPFILSDSDAAPSTGDGVKGFPVPSFMNGMNVVDVRAYCHTQGSSGTTDLVVRRRRGATDADVLSTKVTLGAEYSVADGVINASNDDLATGDILYADIDAVRTGVTGVLLTVGCRLP